MTIAETVSPDVTATVTRFSRTRATVSGTLAVVALPVSGRVLTIQVRRGTTWQRVATVRARSNGTWSVRIPASHGRRLEIRATVSATRQTLSARSAVARLTA